MLSDLAPLGTRCLQSHCCRVFTAFLTMLGAGRVLCVTGRGRRLREGEPCGWTHRGCGPCWPGHQRLSLWGGKYTHLKEGYFVPGREGQAERPQLGAVLGNPPLTPFSVPSGWESERQFDPGGLSRCPCLAPSRLQHDGLGRPLLSRGCPGTVVLDGCP